jgi:hypothetical protein
VIEAKPKLPMNKLIELFTEEPQKVERLILLLLKLILTGVTFEVIYPSHDVVENILKDEFSFWQFSGEAIKWVLFFIIWWFLLWSFFAQTLLNLAVQFISRAFNPAKDLGEFLKISEFLISKPEGKKHINYSIINLENFLEENKDQEGIDISELRTDVYFEIYAVSTVCILMSSDIELSKGQVALWWFVGINLFLIYAYLFRFAKFINSSFHDLYHEAQKKAYIEHSRIALSNIQIVNNQYNFEHKRKHIYLSYKHSQNVKSNLTIIPFFSSEGAIYRELVENNLKMMANSKEEKKQVLFITNIPVQISESTLEKANSSIIIARTEFEMKQGLEAYFHIFLRHRNLNEVNGLLKQSRGE